jgi:hypothetical protein
MRVLKNLLKHFSPQFQNLFLEYKVNFKPRYGHGKPPHELLYAIIDAHRAQYETVLDKALSYSAQIHEIKRNNEEINPLNPAWNNGFLPGLDIIGIYTMVADIKPKKYIEIGSGNSTKVAFKAKKEHGLDMEIVSIDPQPRVEIDQLADKIIRTPFENTDFKFIIDELNENDILFIDNSHRILPNSDSLVFYLELLPCLKKGVVVLIHDVYLPYDYPQFMCDRFYTEQYGLAICLLANPQKYQPLLPNYFISEDEALSRRIAPIWEHVNLNGVERHGGSFWFRMS